MNTNLPPRDIMLELAQRVKAYRLAARMSQRELAAKAGVGYSTVSHFEQGENPNITLLNLIALLRALGLENRILEAVPRLPLSPMALREINKLIPKRVRRKGGSYDQ